MVLHPEACWLGLPTRVQKKKIYNLETGEFVANTRHFQTKHLAGVILWDTFGRETIWREYFKKSFGGNFSINHLEGTLKKKIWREQFQKHI